MENVSKGFILVVEFHWLAQRKLSKGTFSRLQAKAYEYNMNPLFSLATFNVVRLLLIVRVWKADLLR